MPAELNQPARPGADRRARRLLATLACGTAGALLAGPAHAQTFVWNATTPKFWDDNDGQDWIDGQDQTPVPEPFGGQGASALINNGGTAIIRDTIGDIQDIIVGDFDLQTSTLVHNDGLTQLPLGTPGGVFIGRNGSTGTYLMTDTAIQGKQLMLIGSAASSSIPGGEGTLEMTGFAKFEGDQLGVGVGGSVQQRSVGVVGVLDNASIQTNDWLRLHNGIMEIDGQATGSIGTDLWVGQGIANNALFAMAGDSAFVVDGAVRVGLNNADGSIVLSGSARLERRGKNDAYISVGVGGSASAGTIDIRDNASLVSTTNLVIAENGRQSSVDQTGGFVRLRNNPNQPVLQDALEIDPTGEGVGRYRLAGGTLQVESIDASTGVFDFTAGRLLINDTFRGDLNQLGGVLAPGASPGEVTIEGDYNLNSDEEAGVLEIELAGTTPAADYDKINVLGDINLVSGILRVLLYEGFVPALGDRFDFMDWTGTVTGDFDSLELPALGNAMTWNTADLISEGQLAVMLPGDTDGDGDVDDTDLGTIFSHYTGPVGKAGDKNGLHGDTDYDGDVDDTDLGSAFSNYTGPLAPATVPEPASATLLTLALLGVTRRRR